MILQPAPDEDHTGMFQRLVSENQLVEMGIYRVMFGYRVRAGFVGSKGVELDWCGGGNWADVERLYAICKTILSKREENRDCFENLPGQSEVKPFFNDISFTTKVLTASGELTVEPLPLPPPFSFSW